MSGGISETSTPLPREGRSFAIIIASEPVIMFIGTADSRKSSTNFETRGWWETSSTDFPSILMSSSYTSSGDPSGSSAFVTASFGPNISEARLAVSFALATGLESIESTLLYFAATQFHHSTFFHEPHD